MDANEPTFLVRLTAAEAMALKDAALVFALLAEGDDSVIDLAAPPHHDGNTTINTAHMAEAAAERIYQTWVASPDGRRTTMEIALRRMAHDYAKHTN